jgi:hypothetical protein
MSRRDKDKILILVVAIVIVILSVAFYYGTMMIPAGIIVGITLFAQCLLVVPVVYKKYYAINEVDAGFSRFIPLWNEIQMLHPPFAVLTIIGVALTIAAALISRIPLTIIGRVLSVKTMIGWGYNWVVIAILLLVVTNFVLGAGLVGVMRSVNRIIMDEFNERFRVTEAAYYFLAFVPLLRICFFITLNQKLDSLIKSGILDRGEQEFVNEEEQYE